MEEDEQRLRRERNERERELLRRIARNGHDSSTCLEELLRTYRLPILAMFSRAGMAPQDGDALLNGVLLKVWKMARTFRDESMVSTWIYKIAKNDRIDAHRREKRHWFGASSEDELENRPSDAPSPDAALDAQTLDECLKQQLELFSQEHPERSEVLRMKAVDRSSIADIAFFLSRSEHATRQYLYESRKKLDAYVARCAEYQG